MKTLRPRQGHRITDPERADTSPPETGPEVYALAPPDVFRALAGSTGGRTSDVARQRLPEHGPNELPVARRRPAWRQLAAQFTDLFAIVLLAASAITFLAYALEEPREPGTVQLAVAIACVVLLNAAIGFAQEYPAERTAQTLQAMVPH